MGFFDRAGQIAIGSRVRLLGEKIGTDAAKIYESYGVQLNPKWFPVFFVLTSTQHRNVTTIAKEIRHSHVSVSKIVTEMIAAGLIIETPDRKDARRRLLKLSRSGQSIAKKIRTQYLDVQAAIDQINQQAEHNLWESLREWESLLEQKSLAQRVLEMKLLREAPEIKIVPYQPQYRAAFRQLNEQWITTYFKMEKPDYDALDHPQEYILDRGGYILVALRGKKPVGVCALIPRNDQPGTYELAKMAVAPEARGQKIGWLLGQAIIAKARALKAQRIFLESNTILKPAIGLYKKLGFKKIKGPPTPYERCNIQMELHLSRS